MKKLIGVLLVLALVVGAAFAQAAAEGKQELVIYCAGAESEAQALADAFNKIHPNISITILQSSSGDLVTRINTEWPKPEGDVVILMASENLDQVYDKLEGYKTANDAKFTAEQKDQKNGDAPKYYGTSMPLQAIMYNSNLLSAEDAPKSWKDLADPKYAGKIVLANPASSGSAYAQLYMMYKLYGMDFVGQVAKNTTYIASSTAGPDSVARGEYAITVTGEKNIGQKLVAGDPVVYVLPEEGTGLRLEGSAILANCKNPEAAKLFMDFVTSKEALEILSTQFKRRAVSTEIAGPAMLPALSEMTFFEYDAVEAADLKTSLRKQFEAFL